MNLLNFKAKNCEYCGAVLNGNNQLELDNHYTSCKKRKEKIDKLMKKNKDILEKLADGLDNTYVRHLEDELLQLKEKIKELTKERDAARQIAYEAKHGVFEKP